MRRRWIRLGSAVALMAVVAVGCGDPEDGHVNQHDEDVGVEDAGVDVDAGEPDADVEEDVGQDKAHLDEGVDGPFDNCPAISNPDQADRSRDGIGNACDNYPFVYAPDNPEVIEVLHEDDGGPNDDWWDAQENWQMEAPFAIEGVIGESGEEDWYMVRVEEPTNLLVHLEARSNSIWPGLIVMGDDFNSHNRHFSAPILGASDGESEVRDIHLPLPGEYLMVVSDVRNLTAEGAPTGGPDYEYRLYVSEPDLPESEPVTLPTTQQVVPYDEGEVQVFSLDVSGEDALRVQATGAPRNQGSAVFPSIQMKDARTGDMLAYTIQSQVDTDSLHNEVTVKLGDVQEVEVLVEAHQSLGDNDIVVGIEAIDKPEHGESVEQPRHERDDRMLWMRPGAFLESMIGPPIAVADDALEPDIDLFGVYPNAGNYFRVNVDAHSRLIPESSLGYFSGVMSVFSWYEGPVAEEAGESSEFSIYVTDDNVMDTFLEIAHAENFGATLPVGGPDYSYDLELTTLDPHEEAEQGGGDFPASLPVVLQPGEQGLYDFDFEMGTEYTAEFDGMFGRELQLIDLHTGELIAADQSSISFRATPDRDWMLGVHDERGRSIDADDELEVEVEEGEDSAESMDVGDELDGEFAGAGDAEYYRFSASSGEFVQVRLRGEEGNAPAVQLFGDPEATSVVHGEGDDVAWARVEDETELLAQAAYIDGGDSEYTISVDALEIADADLPEIVDDPVADGTSRWAIVDTEEVLNLAINAVGETDDGEPLRFSVHTPDDLAPIETGTGFGVIDVRRHDELYVAVHTAESGQPPEADSRMSISALDPVAFDEELEQLEFPEGVVPAVVALDTDEGGMATLEVDADGERIDVQMVDVTYGVGDVVPEHPSSTAVSHEGARHRGVVIPRDGTGDTREAQLEVEQLTVEDTEPIVDTGPVQLQGWPSAYLGAIGADGDEHEFTAQLDAGETLWAVVVPADESLQEVGPTITVTTPGGEPVDIGADEAMIDGLEIDEAGEWTFHVVSEASGSHDVGLFFMKR